MQNTRWGIIYCPKTGKRHSHKHWEQIREYLAERGVEYDFIQSENIASVERLAMMLATNGYKRIVIVGGDSALNRALNGILTVGNDVELATIPYGFVNDFARYWGFEESDYKRSIDWIVAGRRRLVDVGFAESTTHQKRYFLNCVNIGLASDIMSIQRTARRWGILRYFYRSLMILFRRKVRAMKLKVNHDTINRKVMNVCVGSCRGYGMTPNALPYSGLLDVCVLNQPKLKQLGEGLWLLASGRFLNYKQSEAHRSRGAISIEDTGGAKVSIDGLMWNDYDGSPFVIGLMPEHINFIIPPVNY